MQYIDQTGLNGGVQTVVGAAGQPAMPLVQAPVVVGSQQPLLVEQKVGYGFDMARSWWVFILVAIIVLIILFLIARGSTEWFNSLNNSWGWFASSNNTVLAIVMIIVVLLMAYVSYNAFIRAADYSTRNGIAWTFGLQLIGLIVLFALFYRGQNISAAAWVSVLLFILALVQSYFIYRADPRSFWGMVPYLIWLLANTAFAFHLRSENSVSPI